MMSIEPEHRHGCLRKTWTPADAGGVWRSVAMLVALLLAGWWTDDARGQEKAAARLRADSARPVKGTLFISGGGRLSEASLDRFVDYGGGNECRLVVVTTASETADTPEVEPRIAPFRNLRLGDLCILHTRERDVANSEEFCLPLRQATAVWFIGGHQSRLTEVYLDTRFETEVWRVLERGGVVGGTSAGAAIMSQIMIKGGNPEPELDRGFGFLPGTIVDQHFLKRHRQDRLMNALANYPELVGLGIDEGTTLVVQGRRMSVLSESDSQVMTALAPTGAKPARTELMSPGAEFDLLALARSAVKRVNPRQPTGEPLYTAGLPNGTVVLTGGGETPREATERFVEAAGGSQALIVVVTTAFGENAPDFEEATRFLKEAGATNIVCAHIRDREHASDPAVAELFRQAGGVWFTGGRQWRVIDAIEETPIVDELKAVLERDGAIGGSAAGAAVIASHLLRGNPVSNRQVIGEGYEDGLGLLPATAIDPFFSQRNRREDMAHVKRVHPHLLGLGIDESTAVVIRGREMRVCGHNRVAVFDSIDSEQRADDDFEPLLAGDRYDLIDRTRVGTINDDDARRIVASAADSGDDETPDLSSAPQVCE